jgi:hypothetical protein
VPPSGRDCVTVMLLALAFNLIYPHPFSGKVDEFPCSHVECTALLLEVQLMAVYGAGCTHHPFTTGPRAA